MALADDLDKSRQSEGQLHIAVELLAPTPLDEDHRLPGRVQHVLHRLEERDWPRARHHGSCPRDVERLRESPTRSAASSTPIP